MLVVIVLFILVVANICRFKIPLFNPLCVKEEAQKAMQNMYIRTGFYTSTENRNHMIEISVKRGSYFIKRCVDGVMSHQGILNLGFPITSVGTDIFVNDEQATYSEDGDDSEITFVDPVHGELTYRKALVSGCYATPNTKKTGAPLKNTRKFQPRVHLQDNGCIKKQYLVAQNVDNDIDCAREWWKTACTRPVFSKQYFEYSPRNKTCKAIYQSDVEGCISHPHWKLANIYEINIDC